jgi:septum formation inhibitor-activating ATPase MinD
MLEVPILGIIPEDDSIKESHIMKNSVIYTHPKSHAARTYFNTSRRILGEDIKLEPIPRKIYIINFFRNLGIK